MAEEAASGSAKPRAECRFYERKFPEIDDVVMIEVKSIAEMGAYVTLLEYNNIEGMILLSELSRRRIRSIAKLIKVGRTEPVTVLRVDKDKGYIDLSKRRVSAEEAIQCEERYNKAKVVHSILRHVAETTRSDLESLYAAIAWPLATLYHNAHDAFRVMAQDAEAVLSQLPERPSSEVVEALLKNVKRKMTPQPLKVRADVELTCYAYEGVQAIKEAMRAASSASKEGLEVSIKLIAAPLYVMTTMTLDKRAGMEVLEKACSLCKEAIESKKGRLLIKEAPRVVSAEEDRVMAALEAGEYGESDEEEEGGEEEEEGLDFDEKRAGLTMD